MYLFYVFVSKNSNNGFPTKKTFSKAEINTSCSVTESFLIAEPILSLALEAYLSLFESAAGLESFLAPSLTVSIYI